MFSERIKLMRKKKDITQQEVAEFLGISRPAYSAYESGKREPDYEVLSKLATYYGVTTDYLLGRDIPEWATTKDVMDLEEMLNSNVTMAYGGENLTDAEKQRVRDILTAIFWEKTKEDKSGE